MNINKDAFELGNKRSIIREIFEYSKTRAKEIGIDKVFDFSLGNPSVCPPKEVNDAILDLIKNENQTLLHGYTSAQGDLTVRKAISDNINQRFNAEINENLIYMTCGAAVSLSISLKELFNRNMINFHCKHNEFLIVEDTDSLQEKIESRLNNFCEVK